MPIVFELRDGDGKTFKITSPKARVTAKALLKAYKKQSQTADAFALETADGGPLAPQDILYGCDGRATQLRVVVVAEPAPATVPVAEPPATSADAADAAVADPATLAPRPKPNPAEQARLRKQRKADIAAAGAAGLLAFVKAPPLSDGERRRVSERRRRGEIQSVERDGFLGPADPRGPDRPIGAMAECGDRACACSRLARPGARPAFARAAAAKLAGRRGGTYAGFASGLALFDLCFLDECALAPDVVVLVDPLYASHVLPLYGARPPPATGLPDAENRCMMALRQLSAFLGSGVCAVCSSADLVDLATTWPDTFGIGCLVCCDGSRPATVEFADLLAAPIFAPDALAFELLRHERLTLGAPNPPPADAGDDDDRSKGLDDPDFWKKLLRSRPRARVFEFPGPAASDVALDDLDGASRARARRWLDAAQHLRAAAAGDDVVPGDGASHALLFARPDAAAPKRGALEFGELAAVGAEAGGWRRVTENWTWWREHTRGDGDLWMLPDAPAVARPDPAALAREMRAIEDEHGRAEAAWSAIR